MPMNMPPFPGMPNLPKNLPAPPTQMPPNMPGFPR